MMMRMKNYILATLIAVLFISLVVGLVIRNQATTPQRRAEKSGCGEGGSFVGAVCQYKGGGISSKKKSRVSLPSDFFRGIDTGIPYENTKWKKKKDEF